MDTDRLTRTRLSVLLPAGLHARLVRHANREGISLSEAARRPLDAGLPVLEGRSMPDVVEQRENLGAMQRIRDKALRRYGVYHGDLVNEARAERERQRERVMWGEQGTDEEDEGAE